MSLYPDDVIVHTENPIDSTKRLLDPITELGKTVGYKLNIQKPKAFLYTNNKISVAEIMRNTHVL